jgi:ankyrin repeat protein
MSALDIACRATTLLHERYYFHSQLRPSTIKILVEAGADVNRKDFAGYTPLVYAFYDNDASTARLMIEHGARATPDIYGYLHAVWRFPRGTFDPHLVDLGLQAGASVDGLTLAQERPLYEALERGNVQLTAELLKHGANIHLTGRSRQSPKMLALSILSRKSTAYNAQSQIDAARLVLASAHRPR